MCLNVMGFTGGLSDVSNVVIETWTQGSGDGSLAPRLRSSRVTSFFEDKVVSDLECYVEWQ